MITSSNIKRGRSHVQALRTYPYFLVITFEGTLIACYYLRIIILPS